MDLFIIQCRQYHFFKGLSLKVYWMNKGTVQTIIRLHGCGGWFWSALDTKGICFLPLAVWDSVLLVLKRQPNFSFVFNQFNKKTWLDFISLLILLNFSFVLINLTKKTQLTFITLLILYHFIYFCHMFKGSFVFWLKSKICFEFFSTKTWNWDKT